MYTNNYLTGIGPGIYHITRPKGPVRHHGLLCVDILRAGPVVVDLHPRGLREISIDEFAAGQKVRLEKTRPTNLPAALSRLQQALTRGPHYNLLTRNCEHFVNYVLYGHPRSHQLESVVVSGLLVAGLAIFARR